MTQQFKNIEQSLNRDDAQSQRGWRAWYDDHHRLVSNLFMMLILATICLWVAYVASETNSEGAIIEQVIPQSLDTDAQVERAVKSLAR
jgi:ABC-type antimicrobial peptide transport system permease subunit